MNSPLSMALSRAGSPMTSGIGRSSDDLHYRTPSVTDFQLERVQRRSPSKRRSMPTPEPGYDNALAFRDHVSRFITAKNRLFSISGRIPFDSSQLVLFFRSKSGITHSLDFPIDIEYNTPPALDVLIATCLPHQTSEFDDYPDREALFYPSHLPINTSFDLANHPILGAVQTALFPHFSPDHHITAIRDRVEVLCAGRRMSRQSTSRKDGRSATIIVTLPTRFKGGILTVRDPEGNEEKFTGRSGKDGDIEWIAFLPDCKYDVETVQRGCRMSISYAVFLRSFHPSGPNLDQLIQPSDKLLDLLAPVLNMSRGKRIGFYLAYDYQVDPAETYADAVVPQLISADSLLYHAIKLYKLSPELHWTAGSYIWPADRMVELLYDDVTSSHQIRDIRLEPGSKRMPRPRSPDPDRTVPPMRGPFSDAYASSDVDKLDNLRTRVEDSGAIPLSEANISILTDWNAPSAGVGKQRVYFVSAGELEKLVVNVLLVVYVP